MKKIASSFTSLFFLLILVVLHGVYASHSIQEFAQQRNQAAHKALTFKERKSLVNAYCKVYELPYCLCSLIRTLLYGNPLQYKNKKLPEDLSGQDLCGFNFTGCRFIGINLTNTNLQDVILTNTTCNYVDRFEKNMNKNNRANFSWCSCFIIKLLKDILKFYPNNLHDHESKAKLLHIACGFAQLPFYDNEELSIKLQYWSLQLKLLKDTKKLQLDIQQENQILQVEYRLNQAINRHCSWETTYPQDQLNLSEEKADAHFYHYLQELKNGFCKYRKNIEEGFIGENYYIKQAKESIQWLAKAYPSMRGQVLQQEACKIALALSKIYQIRKPDFIHHYLACQNRLVSLKNMAEKEMNKEEVNELNNINLTPYQKLLLLRGSESVKW